MKKVKDRKIINPTWTAAVVFIVSLTIVFFASRVLYQRTVDLLTENLRERILTVSITAATSINSKDLEMLKVEGDWQTPEWGRVVNQLHKAKYSNKDIVFMYIFRKKDTDQTQMEFVADADSIDPYANTGSDPSRYVDVNRDGKLEPDGPDKLQWPGQDYPEASDIPEAFAAYNGPLTSEDLYTDAYGTVLTGYAPITDEDGNTTAILATDIKADDFFTITRQTLQPFLIFIAFLTSIISILIVFIIYAWKRYTKSLEKINIQLETANEGQTNLIHIINHQIKGYLAKARNIFSELLSEPSYGPVSLTAKPMLEEGFKSLTEGVDFVTDFLIASNIEKGTFVYNMQSLDLKKLVTEVVEKEIEVAKEKGLSLDLRIADGDYNMKGDASQLGQAVKNLIDNSIRYTPKGTINLQLTTDNNKILFIIKDTGVGISDDLKPKLFTKGGRGKDSLKINVNSTGFGLSFVKGVVEAHQGHVWADSAGPNQGSAFYMELPVV
ncbi:MAG: HAMP domain-containing sensor histidine kinase [bacterium]|nr:HAMP domain-containing sensor histidine kinase [bacterium]